MRGLRYAAACCGLAAVGFSQQSISFRASDGAEIAAAEYGKGDRGVVLVHGGRFTKESWTPQAHVLADAGYHVVAIDLRGFGESKGPGDGDPYTAPLYLDVLAAVRYLKNQGAKTVSLVGGSMGGSAAGDASIKAKAGEIDGVVLLGAAPNLPADGLRSRTLFLVARDDANDDGPRLPGIRAQYEKAPEPKRLVVLEGSAHAQYLFQTNQSERVMREILQFLKP